MNIWQTPSGEKFIKDIMDALESEDCLVFIPDSIRPSFMTMFAKTCRNRDSYCPCVPNNEDGIETLKAFFPPTVGLFPKYADFYNNEANHYILVFTLDENTPVWVADFLKNKKNAKWKALCVARPGEVELDKWRVFNFWGKMYPSDSMYAIEQIAEEYHLGPAALCWHSAICHSLCELDITLAYPLIKDAPTTADELADFLFENPFSEFGQEALNFYSRESGSLSRLNPPEKGTSAFNLWRAGALDMAFDDRELVHPAAMLAAGKTADLKLMLVSGQTKVYMPLVANVHAFICRQMTKIYGADWSKPKNSSDDNKHLRELGPLYAWLKRYYIGEWRLANLAAVWMNARNFLAHNDYMPVTMALKAMAEYQKNKNRA